MDVSTFCEENLWMKVLSARGTYGYKYFLRGEPMDESAFYMENLWI
jgi:hypothetical protein